MRNNFRLTKQVFYFFTIISILLPGSLIGQSDYSDFNEKLKNNTFLFETNIDSAYNELDDLIIEAQSFNDTIVELNLLERKCRYYYQTNQPDELITASEKLLQKSQKYNETYTQVMSYTYIAEAYSANLVNKKSLDFLNQALEVIDKSSEKNKKIILAKANVLNSFANTYISMGEPEKAAAKLKDVINNYKELDDVSEIVRFQYLNYSNIANIYTLFNIDSAEYYALKSINLRPANTDSDKIMLTNYSVLGKVNMKKELYQNALFYYNKALFISDATGQQLNKEDIYINLIDLYNIIGKKDSAIIYDNKLKELEISSLKKKYTSLQLIIEKDNHPKDQSWYLWLVIPAGLLVVLIVLIVFFSKRSKNEQIDPERTYNTLIQLVKSNDSGFMFSFDQAFPDFSKKLLKINPQLSKSEIEFAALLKLNLSTKEIATYKFIETRTVQNKKHRLRKRLNIPSTIDIYNWFSEI